MWRGKEAFEILHLVVTLTSATFSDFSSYLVLGSQGARFHSKELEWFNNPLAECMQIA